MKGIESLYVKEKILLYLYGNNQEEIQIIIPIHNEIYTQIKIALLYDLGGLDYLIYNRPVNPTTYLSLIPI